MAERLRAATAALRIDAAPGLAITASFGVAVTGTAPTTAASDDVPAMVLLGEQLVMRADTALYAAKNGGRNRAVLAGE